MDVTRLPNAAIAAVALSTLATAQVSIPVANHSFEANPVATNCFHVLNINDWQPYDPNGILDTGLDVLGGINAIPGSIYFPAGMPDGEHAALVFVQGDIGAGEVGITQTLDAELEPFTTYELSVEVGNIASGQGPAPCDVFGFFNLDNFPGYRIEILAGDQVVAVDDNSLFDLIPEGAFATATCSVTVGKRHPQLGQPLTIRLVNLNQIQTPEAPGIEVDFDNVQLTATSLLLEPQDDTAELGPVNTAPLRFITLEPLLPSGRFGWPIKWNGPS